MAPHRLIHTISHPAILLLTLVSTSALAAAQDDDQKPFDCRITLGDSKYDLTGLAGEHTLERELRQPPSTVLDTLTFNLCEDIKHRGTVPDDDQVRVCCIKPPPAVRKQKRRLSVRDASVSDQDEPEERAQRPRHVCRSACELVRERGLVRSIKLTQGSGADIRGAWYPSPVDSTPVPQSFHLKLLCEPDKESADLNFLSYNGTDLWLEWQAAAGCPLGSPPDEDTSKPDEGGGDSSGDGKQEESVGSGIGYFFLLMFLALVAYFGLGAYYNYSTYGASGADLIPHRDFWREVPYMVRDLVSHIYSAVRPRQSSSRGGYIAV
ncbi:autophagy-related protein 27 [Daedaleopsis nitida]|nr:autophagy-related protein 27 [Daedaleopsis nitida]